MSFYPEMLPAYLCQQSEPPEPVCPDCGSDDCDCTDEEEDEP